MGRAKWKGPYANIENLKILNKSKKQHIYLITRNSEILPKFVGLTFKIHNGKTFKEVTVSNSMVGYKFGEFVFTRARFSFKRKKLKK